MSTRYFLALDGVKGDSLNSTYKGWFEVNSFDIDLTGAGGGAGTAFSPLTLMLDSNTGLAPLLALAATGEHLNGATLVGVTDGAEQKVYQLDLADVLVTNVEHHADPITEGGPTLTLDYSKIELETFTPDGTGGIVPEGQFGFDLTANTAGITVPSADPGGSVAASPQPLIDYFMLIPGLNGGSVHKDHVGWFEISSVDLDMEKIVGGKLDTLNVTMLGEAGLAELMRSAIMGASPGGGGGIGIEGVRIQGIKVGGGATQPEVYDLTLADVAVTKVADDEGAGYSLSLDYGKIALVTNGIEQGTPIKNGEFAYDVINNTEIAPFSLGLKIGSQSPAVSASEYFLTLPGVDGDFLNPNFKGSFEVSSFDFDVENVRPGNTKAAFSPLTLTLDSNTALAPLLTMAATNDHFKTVTLQGGDNQNVFYQLDLGLVFVTKVDDGAGAGVTVSLDFGAIKLTTFAQDGKSPVEEFFWNVATNSDDPSIPDPSIASAVNATSQAAVLAGPRVRGEEPALSLEAATTASPEPATYFMLIDGLNGGSTDKLHRGWFEITGFDFDLMTVVNIGSANGGVSIGKPNFSPLNVTLPHEAGLADVMDLAATGGLVKGVRIEGFTGGTTPAEVYELTLADVAVTKVADDEGGGYSLSFDYGKIALVTRDETGQPISNGAFAFDVVTNTTGFNPSSLALSPDSSGGPVAPAKYFLAIDGVKGDTLDANHKGWFEVSNFDIDLDNPFLRGGPGQPGKAAFSPLTLTLDSNTGLAPLLELAATGGHLNGATLVGVTAGAQDKVYQLDLADVRVTKVDDDAGAGLTLGLGYSKIELETFTQDGAGGLAPEGQFGFDLKVNTSDITVPSVLPSGSVDPSPPPETYFMVIDGVNGGSQDKQHLGWFEISGFDLDLANATVVGGGTGSAAFSPLNVTLPHEAGLADVMDLAATGGLVKGVRIEGFTGGTTPAEVYELTLADVAVTKVADDEGGGYSLSFDYGKIALVTRDETGQPISNGAFAYDVANNIEIDPISLSLSPSGNQAPVADAQSISTDEDTAVAVTLSGSDVEGDSLTFTVVSGPAHGTLAGSGANLTYTPAANYNGPDSFTYLANDGALDSEAASVSLTVNSVNDAPVADAQSISTDEDTAVAVTLSGSDVEGDSLTFTVVSGPAHGTLAGSGANLTYTPAANYNGPDSFTYLANDGALDSEAASVSLTVNSVNDAPVFISPATFVILENDTTIGTVTATDPDTGQTLSYSIIPGADAGKFTIGSSTGALSFVTAPNFELPSDAGGNNVYDVAVQVSDGDGGIDTQAIAVTVTDQSELFDDNANEVDFNQLSPTQTSALANLADRYHALGGNDVVTLPSSGASIPGGYSEANLFEAGPGDDKATGGNRNDRIDGGDGNDNIDGGDGNDLLAGGPGNDSIDGGDGIDSAIFSGLRSSYTLTDLGHSSVRVAGPDGIDTSTKIEELVFDDQSFILDSLTTLNLDGSSAVHSWDALDQYAWSDVVWNYTNQNELKDQTVLYDDGHFNFDVFDTDNAAWSSMSTQYNTQGQPTSQSLRYDDGRLAEYVFDNTGQEWSLLANNYDAAGRLEHQTLFYDDGRQWQLTFDTQGQPWAILSERYDPIGHIVSQQLFYDDGHSQIFI